MGRDGLEARATLVESVWLRLRFDTGKKQDICNGDARCLSCRRGIERERLERLNSALFLGLQLRAL